MEKNNSLQINFKKQLYSKTALEAAVLAFADLAQYNIIDDEKCFQVEICDIDAEVVDSIADEFTNYVLARMRIKN